MLGRTRCLRPDSHDQIMVTTAGFRCLRHPAHNAAVSPQSRVLWYRGPRIGRLCGTRDTWLLGDVRRRRTGVARPPMQIPGVGLHSTPSFGSCGAETAGAREASPVRRPKIGGSTGPSTVVTAPRRMSRVPVSSHCRAASAGCGTPLIRIRCLALKHAHPRRREQEARRCSSQPLAKCHVHAPLPASGPCRPRSPSRAHDDGPRARGAPRLFV